jgi:2-polyprenyl-6-methoxyphenol hydroxylase-like FAD-dependent oxidoreductase
VATEQFDVCVVGGGPAGSVAALRLAQLGHRICLVESCAFPRQHVGESLTMGIWPIFDLLGVREPLAQEGFLRAGETLVRWAEPYTERLPPNQTGIGLLVDRGKFDAFLLGGAGAAGVRVFQPGQVRGASCNDFGWQVEVSSKGESHSINAAFLVDATGRNGFLSRKRERISSRTVALCGYLRGQGCPQSTLVEALCDAWCWGAPIPGGLFSTMVFLDPDTLRRLRREAFEKFWRSQLLKTELFTNISRLPLVGPLIARDATTYFAVDPIRPYLIRVGEASCSLDPLSSTGVEKAMQTGLIAAIALHTMLLRPDSKELCARFYRDRLKEIVSTHAAWSAGFYGEVKRYAEFPFWQARSGVSEYREREENLWRPSLPKGSFGLSTQVRISDKTQLIEEPCIVDDQIRSRAALLHPSLRRPVAFVEGVEVARLLEMVPWSPDLGRLLALWSSQLSPRQAQRVAAWLMGNQILERVS